MNITFLIGNGFDIGVGMKSKFKDFFPIYQVLSKSKPSRIRQLAEEIGEDYDTWADFEAALGMYTAKFSKENKQDFIDQLKDFEREFVQYLKEQEEALCFDDSDAISNVMLGALKEYYKNDNLPIESAQIISGIYSNRARESRVYNFVDFNYTEVLENCLKTIKSGIVVKRVVSGIEHTDRVGKIIHVHGSFDNSPIIGVNDISQISNKELSQDRRFTQLFVKPSLNMRLRMNYDVDSTEMIRQSQIICIYGMSLGITDRKWWEMIIKWLANDPSRQLVIFNYDGLYTSTTQFDWLEKEDSIIDILTSFSEISEDDFEKIRKRIHVAINKNIFHMDLMNKHNEMMRMAMGLTAV